MPSEVQRLDGTTRHLRLVPQQEESPWFGRPSLEEHCGLRLVDAVARSWGVSASGRPDRAWARVPRLP